MLIWILFAALLGGAVLAVLAPLGRRVVGAETTTDSRAIYEAQLSELARDEERGLISAADAEMARAELGRRLIRAVRSEPGGNETVGEAMFRRRKAASAIILAVVPVVALAFYGAKGSPHLPAQPMSARLSAIRTPWTWRWR